MHTIDSLTIAEFKRMQDSESKNTDADNWAELNDAITSIIGINEPYVQYLKHRAKAVVLKASGVRFNETLAEIEEHQATELAKDFGEGASFTRELLLLSKMQGYRVDPEKTSIREYYEMKALYNDNGKK